MGNGARPGGKRARAHKRTSAQARRPAPTPSPIRRRHTGTEGSGGDQARGVCVCWGLDTYKMQRGRRGCDAAWSAPARKIRRQVPGVGRANLFFAGSINKRNHQPSISARAIPRASHRGTAGIENHETDYVGAPKRQAGVDNGWETEERRAGLTSLRRLRRGRVGRGVRARVALLVGFPLGGRFVLRRPSSGSGSAPFRWRARSRAPERG